MAIIASRTPFSFSKLIDLDKVSLFTELPKVADADLDKLKKMLLSVSYMSSSISDGSTAITASILQGRLSARMYSALTMAGCLLSKMPMADMTEVFSEMKKVSGKAKSHDRKRNSVFNQRPGAIGEKENLLAILSIMPAELLEVLSSLSLNNFRAICNMLSLSVNAMMGDVSVDGTGLASWSLMPETPQQEAFEQKLSKWGLVKAMRSDKEPLGEGVQKQVMKFMMAKTEKEIEAAREKLEDLKIGERVKSLVESSLNVRELQADTKKGSGELMLFPSFLLESVKPLTNRLIIANFDPSLYVADVVGLAAVLSNPSKAEMKASVATWANERTTALDIGFKGDQTLMQSDVLLAATKMGYTASSPVKTKAPATSSGLSEEELEELEKEIEESEEAMDDAQKSAFKAAMMVLRNKGDLKKEEVSSLIAMFKPTSSVSPPVPKPPATKENLWPDCADLIVQLVEAKKKDLALLLTKSCATIPADFAKVDFKGMNAHIKASNSFLAFWKFGIMLVNTAKPAKDLLITYMLELLSKIYVSRDEAEGQAIMRQLMTFLVRSEEKKVDLYLPELVDDSVNLLDTRIVLKNMVTMWKTGTRVLPTEPPAMFLRSTRIDCEAGWQSYGLFELMMLQGVFDTMLEKGFFKDAHGEKVKKALVFDTQCGDFKHRKVV